MVDDPDTSPQPVVLDDESFDPLTRELSNPDPPTEALRKLLSPRPDDHPFGDDIRPETDDERHHRHVIEAMVIEEAMLHDLPWANPAVIEQWHACPNTPGDAVRALGRERTLEIHGSIWAHMLVLGKTAEQRREAQLATVPVTLTLRQFAMLLERVGQVNAMCAGDRQRTLTTVWSMIADTALEEIGTPHINEFWRGGLARVGDRSSPQS